LDYISTHFLDNYFLGLDLRFDLADMLRNQEDRQGQPQEDYSDPARGRNLARQKMKGPAKL
jgi:hypothetical protein